MSAGGGPLEGTATTAPLSLGNKRLLVNVVTRKRGDLRVELLDRAGGVLPGFSREDCTPLVGDHHAIQVAWKGGQRVPAGSDRVRFILRRAFLYGFEGRE